MNLLTLDWLLNSALYLFIIIVCVVSVVVSITARIEAHKQNRPECFGVSLKRSLDLDKQCCLCPFMEECKPVPECYKTGIMYTDIHYAFGTCDKCEHFADCAEDGFKANSSEGQ